MLLIAAAILASRKLIQLDSARPSPEMVVAIHDAVVLADRIMQQIDRLWPARPSLGSARP